LKLAVGIAIGVRTSIGHLDLALIFSIVAAAVSKRKDTSTTEAMEDLIAQFIEYADLPRLARFQRGIDEPISQRPVEKSVSRKRQRCLHGPSKETVLTLLF
jgi:hypothetical protein